MHKYERIREAISAMAAEAGPGAQIPPEKELAQRFGASTMTVRRALQILTESGLLHGVPGKGTFVARPRVTKMTRVSNSFTEALQASGRRAGSRLISATLRPPVDEAERAFFDVGEGHDLTGSLYELIEQRYHLEIERTGIIVSARLPTESEAKLLEVARTAPCLQTVVTSRVAGGPNLERTVALYRGDMYELAL